MNKPKKKQNKAVKFLIYTLVIALPWIAIYFIANGIKESRTVKTENSAPGFKKKISASVDHSQFEILQQDFEHPSEVTEACLSCHNGRDEEIMKTSHWKWSKEIIRTEGDTVRAGKKNAFNNYCAHISSNEWKCTKCHAGYGWKDKTFDFTESKNVDCMICHDLTGAYEKTPLGSGMPAMEKEEYKDKTYFPPNYNYISQNVGLPEIKNCGVCHFYGGGGDNTKHGDLSSDLLYAHKNIDVHMDTEGNGMNCVDCHTTENHNITGQCLDPSGTQKSKVQCLDCHSDHKHANNTIERHTNRVACQTCHIPVYAKGVHTNMTWDWSTAGKKDEDGNGYTKTDTASGRYAYRSAKGTYTWENYVTPEYIWADGSCSKHIVGDSIRDTSLLVINPMGGSAQDPNSKLIPVKVHRGKQPYDTENRYLITPHIYGKDENAFDVSLDWDRAIKSGMEYTGLEYSGKFGFIKTEYYHALNHMVAPAEQALKCIDCHSKDGRLANVAGFYMPGRDQNKFADILGILMVLGSIVGISLHAGIRLKNRKK